MIPEIVASARPERVPLACRACGLWSMGCTTPFLAGRGSTTADLMIVGDYPGAQEDIQGRPWVGQAFALLRDLLVRRGIDPECAFWTNVLRCRLPFGVEPEPHQLEACHGFLEAELAAGNPKVVLAVGKLAAKSVLGMSDLRDARREVWDLDGRMVVASYNPAAGLRDTTYAVALASDLTRVARALEGTLVRAQTFDYRVLASADEVRAALTTLRAAPFVTFDLETNMLWPYDLPNEIVDAPRILSMALSGAAGTAVVVPWHHPGCVLPVPEQREVARLVGEFLADPTVLKVGQNAKFDILWLLWAGFEVRGLVGDTLIASHLLDETARHGLERLVWDHTDIGPYWRALDTVMATIRAADRARAEACATRLKELDAVEAKLLKASGADTARRTGLDAELGPERANVLLDLALAKAAVATKTYERIAWSKLWPYNAADADATWRVWHAQLPLLEAEDLMGVMRAIYAPASVAFARMQRSGVLYSLDKRAELMGRVSTAARDVLGRLRRLPSVREFETKLAVANAPVEEEGYRFNPGSNEQVAALFYDHMRLAVTDRYLHGKAEKRSVDADILTHWSTRGSAAAKHLLRWRKIDKYRSTYIEPVPKWVKVDGRVHSDFNLLGTRTGRIATSNPNLLNMPREDDEEAIDIGLPSPKVMWVSRFAQGSIVEADFSQIEVRVFASFSGDPGLLDVFSRGGDVHRAVAAEVWKLPPEQVSEPLRHRAKRIVFGLNYGAQAEKVAALAGCTVVEAQEFLDGYFTRFPGVRQWMRAQETFVCAHGYVRTATGQKRRLLAAYGKSPVTDDAKVQEALRQAINTPVQGSASHIALTAISLIDQIFEARRLRSRIICHVYDSIIFDVHPDEFNVVCHIARKVMCNVKFPWLHTPLEVDIKAGRSWGETEKVRAL